MEKLHNLLACPNCKHDLKINNDNAFCSNEACQHHSLPFSKFQNKFILVDFNKSILKSSSISEDVNLELVQRNQTSNTVRKVLRRVLNGSPNTSKYNFQKALSGVKLNHSLRILIIGGGTIGEGLDEFYSNYKDSIISFDVYDSINVDFIADAHSIPLKSNSIDLIIIQAVLEHVFNPMEVVDECYRVLKSDGVIYAETPFLQGVHEGAYDFTRYSVLGHRILFKKFFATETGVIGGAGVSLLWSIEYFFRGLFRSVLIGKFFKAIFIWIRWLEKLIPEKYNIDGACGSYFIGIKQDNIIELQPWEYLQDYKGAQ